MWKLFDGSPWTKVLKSYDLHCFLQKQPHEWSRPKANDNGTNFERATFMVFSVQEIDMAGKFPSSKRLKIMQKLCMMNRKTPWDRLPSISSSNIPKPRDHEREQPSKAQNQSTGNVQSVKYAKNCCLIAGSLVASFRYRVRVSMCSPSSSRWIVTNNGRGTKVVDLSDDRVAFISWSSGPWSWTTLQLPVLPWTTPTTFDSANCSTRDMCTFLPNNLVPIHILPCWPRNHDLFDRNECSYHSRCRNTPQVGSCWSCAAWWRLYVVVPMAGWCTKIPMHLALCAPIPCASARMQLDPTTRLVIYLSMHFSWWRRTLGWSLSSLVAQLSWSILAFHLQLDSMHQDRGVIPWKDVKYWEGCKNWYRDMCSRWGPWRCATVGSTMVPLWKYSDPATRT